ncbi:MAG TPA: Ig-like domain-containing protein, partial [Gammaproteobacteria bacterium]|nr:Ig-like domain-containing protein [Gammaproteobacteria bacterium]
DIDVIRQWIADGALPTPPAGLDPLRVTSMAPLPGSVESALPATITAIFDRELDATSVTTATFVLERSGGDGTFGDGNEVAIMPASVAVPLANSRTAGMDLAGVASVEDTYRVTLVGTGPAVILDLDTNALDGEFGGTFPSGNGAAGGNFEADFDVAGIQPTLQSIQTHVFTPVCSACHTGVGAALPGVMDLTSVNASYANLVDVASLQVSALDRVEPGDPDNSYLIRKLEGGPGISGDRMPRFGPYLDQTTVDAIRQWITDGAAP